MTSGLRAAGCPPESIHVRIELSGGPVSRVNGLYSTHRGRGDLGASARIGDNDFSLREADGSYHR